MSSARSESTRLIAGVLFLCASWALQPAHAYGGERLTATGGVTQIEGAAGGGMVPWALIAGYGTRDEVGFTTSYTHLFIDDFRLQSAGVAIGIFDRLEISLARQPLELESTVRGQSISQNMVGIKLKLVGDAIFDQDILLPQIAIGALFKNNLDFAVPRSLGAKKESGTDVYLPATKLHLAALAGCNVLWNTTARATKANHSGLLGFGGDKNDDYRLKFEGSLAFFIHDRLAVGMEYRAKPDSLSVFKEDSFKDVFVAFAPDQRFLFTAAYANLSNVADKANQHALYLSGQLSF